MSVILIIACRCIMIWAINGILHNLLNKAKSESKGTTGGITLLLLSCLV